MAKLTFLLQGLSEKISHYQEILNLLKTPKPNKIILSTAFLRSKAVLLLEKELLKINKNLDFYVGIGNNVTSYQALKSLLDIGINPYLVDTGCSDLIFHPKVYLVQSTFNNYAKVISGSANFTPRGLVGNIEGSTIVELDLNLPEDVQYLDDIFMSFELLRNQHIDNIFKVHTEKELKDLLNQNRLLDESLTSTISVNKEDLTIIKDTSSGNKSDSKVPRMKLKTQKVKFPSSTLTTNTITPTGLHNNRVSNLLWESDLLTNRDLNVKVSSNTHLTGSINLDAGKYNIPNFQTFFRYQAFESLSWSFSNSRYPHNEYAVGQFELVILGNHYGNFNLELVHNTNSTSKTALQKNSLTRLKWGKAKTIVANSTLVGNTTLKIYQNTNTNNFILEIS